MENCFIQGQGPWHSVCRYKDNLLKKPFVGTSDSSLLDVMLRETLRKKLFEIAKWSGKG